MNERFSEEQFTHLMHRSEEGHAGDETVFTCSVQHTDHIHVRRLGDKGDGDEGRVGILLHDPEQGMSVFFSPSEARTIAATLLDVADELDDVQPLVFHDPVVIPQEALDVPEEADEDTINIVRGFNPRHDDEDEQEPDPEETEVNSHDYTKDDLVHENGYLKPLPMGGFLVFRHGSRKVINYVETYEDGIQILDDL